ncbi:endopeptidase La, partial [Salmonella enterica subsp. enterica serovar Minnesota]
GYLETEKVQIARQFLVPKQIAAAGLEGRELKIGIPTLRDLVNRYTREAGVRNLEREIGQICRKAARRIAEGEKGPFAVTRGKLAKYLGAPKHIPETEGEA